MAVALQGPSAVQAAPEPHHEDLHPHMGLAGELGAVIKRYFGIAQVTSQDVKTHALPAVEHIPKDSPRS